MFELPLSNAEVYADKDNQILRISSSDIAAISGFHPFKNKWQIVEKHLFQDLSNLLSLDAENLGIAVVSKEQEIADIISALPPSESIAFERLRELSKLRSVTTDASASNVLINQFNAILENESVKAAIPSESLAILRDEISGDIRMRYGTECEELAIVRYEELVGYSVGCRNDETYVWPLHSSCFSNTDALGSTESTTFCDVRPAGEAYSVENLRYHRFTLAHAREKKGASKSVSNLVLDLSSETFTADNDDDDDQSRSSSAICSLHADTISPTSPSFTSPIMSHLSTTDPSDALTVPKEMPTTEGKLLDLAGPTLLHEKKATLESSSSDCNSETPLFYIVGKVDGVSIQPLFEMKTFNQHKHYGNQNEKQMRVVVEVKNRMSRIPAEPPLYDQIQLVAYMLMLGCTHGDLVQTISSSGKGAGKGVVGGATCSYSGDGSAVMDLTPPSPMPIATFIPSSSPSSQFSPSKSPIVHVDGAKRCSDVISTGEDNCVDHTIGHVGFPGPPVGTTTNNNNNNKDSKNHPPSKRPTKRSANSSDRNIIMDDDFSVYRVDLNASPYFHRDNFISIIMPRLKIFRDAIMLLRADDSLRYEWLLSSEQEKMQILYRLCPYLKDAM